MRRVYRQPRVGVINDHIGLAETVEDAKALAEADAAKRRQHGRYFMESAWGQVTMNVRQLNGEYRVLDVHDPRPRTEGELNRIFARFGGEDDYE